MTTGISARTGAAAGAGASDTSSAAALLVSSTPAVFASVSIVLSLRLSDSVCVVLCAHITYRKKKPDRSQKSGTSEPNLFINTHSPKNIAAIGGQRTRSQRRGWRCVAPLTMNLLWNAVCSRIVDRVVKPSASSTAPAHIPDTERREVLPVPAAGVRHGGFADVQGGRRAVQRRS